MGKRADQQQDRRFEELAAVVQGLGEEVRVLKAQVRRLAGKARREHRLSKINRKVIEPPTDDYGRLLTVPEVRKILNCSREKIYNLHAESSLEMVKFGGQTRITDTSVRALMTSLLPLERKRATVRPARP